MENIIKKKIILKKKHLQNNKMIDKKIVTYNNDQHLKYHKNNHQKN